MTRMRRIQLVAMLVVGMGAARMVSPERGEAEELPDCIEMFPAPVCPAGPLDPWNQYCGQCELVPACIWLGESGWYVYCTYATS